jgi:hypothetical protein
MGFRSLQRSRMRKSTCAGFARADAVRLQGLVTLLTAYSFRAPAGFVSHRRRSWDSPFGASSSRKVSGAFPPGRTHIPFILPLLPLPKQRAGRAGRGFWASTLARALAADVGLARRLLAAPLGFTLLGCTDRSLSRDFARLPLTRFFTCPQARAGAAESLSTSAWTVPQIAASRGSRSGQPF